MNLWLDFSTGDTQANAKIPCDLAVTKSHGNYMYFLFAFLEEEKGTLDDVVALVDETEVFVAVPNVVGNG